MGEAPTGQIAAVEDDAAHLSASDTQLPSKTPREWTRRHRDEQELSMIEGDGMRDRGDYTPISQCPRQPTLKEE
jgi:hypothetical protein